MIDVRCPHCGFEKQISSTLAGRWLQCPKCDGLLRAPRTQAVPPTDAGPRPLPLPARVVKRRKPYERNPYDEVEVFVPARQPAPAPPKRRVRPVPDEPPRRPAPPRYVEREAPRRSRQPRDDGLVWTVRIYGLVYVALSGTAILLRLLTAPLLLSPAMSEAPERVVGAVAGVVINLIGAVLVGAVGIGLYRKMLAGAIGLYVVSILSLGCCGFQALFLFTLTAVVLGKEPQMGGAVAGTGLLAFAVFLFVWIIAFGIPVAFTSFRLKAFE